jgi:hypothetical protein
MGIGPVTIGISFAEALGGTLLMSAEGVDCAEMIKGSVCDEY